MAIGGAHPAHESVGLVEERDVGGGPPLVVEAARRLSVQQRELVAVEQPVGGGRGGTPVAEHPPHQRSRARGGPGAGDEPLEDTVVLRVAREVGPRGGLAAVLGEEPGLDPAREQGPVHLPRRGVVEASGRRRPLRVGDVVGGEANPTPRQVELDGLGGERALVGERAGQHLRHAGVALQRRDRCRLVGPHGEPGGEETVDGVLRDRMLTE